jgi:hypothetical protein
MTQEGRKLNRKNSDLALKYWKHAAEHGYVDAMEEYGRHSFKYDDPERYEWFGRALIAGKRELYGVFMYQLRIMSVYNQVTYTIGKYLRNYAYSTKDAELAIQFYRQTNQHARNAVDTWSLIGRRLVNRDIRKMIWARRAGFADFILPPK